jgi:hypothetical protein
MPSERKQNGAILHFYVKRFDAVFTVAARLHYLAGIETHAPVVERARDSCAAHDAIGQWAAAVRAAILHSHEALS